jgi:hypothetical protein
LRKFSTDRFEIERKGESLISIKKNGIGNSILITVKEIDDLVETLHKAKEVFK